MTWQTREHCAWFCHKVEKLKLGFKGKQVDNMLQNESIGCKTETCVYVLNRFIFLYINNARKSIIQKDANEVPLAVIVLTPI